MDGVVVLELKAGAGLSKAAVLQHRGGRADVGSGAAGRAQITLVQQLEQLLLSGATCILERNTHSDGRSKVSCAAPPSTVRSPTLVLSLVDHIHGRGQVPHLDAAVGVASEQVAPRPGAHPAGALALSHRERGDCSTVYSLDLTYSFSSR